MQKRQFDFVIVGGGIAGMAVSAELAERGSVLILGRETSLAYHTTGRSAAISMESYLRYKLSFRNLVEIMAERGLSLAHRTIMRWAKRFRNAAIRPAVWKAVLSAR